MKRYFYSNQQERGERMYLKASLFLSIAFVTSILNSTILWAEIDISQQIYEKNKDAICDVMTKAVMKDGSVSEWNGTGFFVDKEGHILTANHVARLDEDDKRTPKIERYEYSVVITSKNRRYNAKMVGGSYATDIALLKVSKIKPEDFTVVTIGDPDKLKIGEPLWALGNPSDLSNTFTRGIISYLHRQIDAGYIQDFIQTDCAVNSGNSGSPVFNSQGEVVGINEQIVRDTEGLNFAISIKLARIDLLKKGHLNLPTLGAEALLTNFPRDAKSKDKPGFLDQKFLSEKTHILDGDDLDAMAMASYDNCAIITQIDEYEDPDADDKVPSPAKKAGLEKGDLITSIDSRAVRNGMDIRISLMDKKTGDKIKIKYQRAEDGKMADHETELALVKRKEISVDDEEEDASNKGKKKVNK